MIHYFFWALLVLPAIPAGAASLGSPGQGQPTAADWPAANKAVEEAGGWKAYLRESAAAQAEKRFPAFRSDQSLAQQAAQARLFSEVLDGWVSSAIGAQPGLQTATALLARELSSARHLRQISTSSRATLSQALVVARQVTDDAIVLLFAQEQHARQREREDLAEVSWELAQRMHAVGNIPLVEERKARLHLLEAQSAVYKAEARMLAARESLARHLRPAGNWTLPANSLVLPLPGPATQERAASAITGIANLFSAEQRSAAAERARREPAQTHGLRHAYGLRHTYAALVQAEDQLQRAGGRARLLAEEGLAVRAAISEEHLLAYNGMLIGTPKLLKDRDTAMAFELEVLESLRDYWLARSRRDHQQVSVLLEELFWGVTP